MQISPGQPRVGIGWLRTAMLFGMAAFAVTATSHGQSGIALSNVSTRGMAGAGENVMIAGFIIEGTTPRTVAIRVLGPSLTTYGVTGVLANPNLTLNSAGVDLASNDDWQSDATSAAALRAANLAPTSPLEPALVRTLPPGGYTVLARGSGTSTGVVLMEAYDLDAASSGQSGSRLINLSTRGRVGTGDSVMIMGFIIGGSVARDVLVTTIAGSLGEYGVAGVLNDPKMEIFAGQQKIAESDDWIDSPDFETIARTGFSPRNPLESAVWLHLNPGAYTAVVSGVNGLQGVSLPEVYDVRQLNDVRFSPFGIADSKAKLSFSSGAPGQILDLSFVGEGVATVNGGANGTYAYSPSDDFRATLTVDASGYTLTGTLLFYRDGYGVFSGTARLPGGTVQNVGGILAFEKQP